MSLSTSRRLLLIVGLMAGIGCYAVSATAAAAAAPSRVVTGEIVILIGDDFVGNRSTELILLRDAETGETLDLSFPRQPVPRLRTGDRVRVTIRPEGRRAHVERWEIISEGRAGTAGAAAPKVISGGLKSAVLIVNFLDSAVTCTPSEIAGSVYTGASSVDSLFREMSFNLVSFPGDTNQNGQPDVFGPFTINATTAETCDDTWDWAEAADAAAQAAGINLSLYGYKMYVVPSNTGCGYGGLGMVGDPRQITPTSCYPGLQCRAWNFFCAATSIYAHELGHNIGMNHASSDSNNDGHLESEYGDYSDVMGSGGLIHFNGPHKVHSGWIPPGHVLDVGASGVFTLAAIEINPASTALPQALRIFNFYQVSYRKPIGYDGGLGSPFPNATSIHRHSNLLDYTNSPPWDVLGYRYLDGNTLWASTLSDGQSFSDPANGLTVQQLSHTADTVTVQVTVARPDRRFHTITPCRWFDTRTTVGTDPSPLFSGQETVFQVAGHCGIPATARALSVNVTVTGASNAGHIAFYPAHLTSFNTSTINFARGQTRANNAILPLSAEGYQSIGVTPFVSGEGTVHLFIDVNGYFE